MCWKIAKIAKINNLLKIPHPQQWSITTRLTWIYTLSTFIMLMIVTFSLYWIFTTRLEKENYQFLQNKIQVLQKLLQANTNNHVLLKEEIILEPSLYHYYVRIINNDNKIAIETPNMSDEVPITAFDNITKKSNVVSSTNWISPKRKNRKRHDYLLLSTAANNSTNQYIQMAMDISGERKIVKDYREGVFFILLIGIFCSALLGMLVTRRGLKPLRDMTSSTQRITVTKLKERLNPITWPKELFVFATAFNDMLNRIEEGVNRLSQFSGDLAHELRTPINVLMGEAEISLSRPRSAEEYRAVIESSLEEFQRLSQMIENLLFLAATENPNIHFHPKIIDIKKIIDNVINFFDAISEDKNVKIISEGKSNFIVGDESMLQRAFTNFVSNALQHTQAGGVIKLSIQSLQEGTCYLTITDTGDGISAEHIPHLFDRFYRVDTARSKQTGGTGLGLAIVKSIMELHKANIMIDSRIGQGTTVTLIFFNPRS